jgi:hypothetical protein
MRELETLLTAAPSATKNVAKSVSQQPIHRKLTWRQKHLRGWRFGILSGAFVATAVFLLNTIAFAYLKSRKQTGKGAPDAIFEGSCNKTRLLNVAIHFVINALSTILLGTSNFGMQCLVAPTRSEVDTAHSKGKWLDIGIPSIRNLSSISRKRLVLWFLLAASSLPLHLMYVC